MPFRRRFLTHRRDLSWFLGKSLRLELPKKVRNAFSSVFAAHFWSELFPIFRSRLLPLSHIFPAKSLRWVDSSAPGEMPSSPLHTEHQVPHWDRKSRYLRSLPFHYRVLSLIHQHKTTATIFFILGIAFAIAVMAIVAYIVYLRTRWLSRERSRPSVQQPLETIRTRRCENILTQKTWVLNQYESIVNC